MRKTISLSSVCLLLSTSAVMAQQWVPKAIVEVEAGNKIYLYNDQFDQIDELSEKDMSALLQSPLTVEAEGEKPATGILIQQFNADEGMYQVELAGKGMVWVESLAFKVWPADRKIECPASITGQIQETQEDGTVGFGGCELEP